MGCGGEYAGHLKLPNESEISDFITSQGLNEAAIIPFDRHAFGARMRRMLRRRDYFQGRDRGS